jgi:periplasmic protein TonB
MFQDAMVLHDKRLMVRWPALPASLLVHGALVLALIVLPLLRDNILPRVELRDALLVPPPPVAPPPLPKGRPGASGTKRIKAVALRPHDTGRFLAPVDIPELTTDEAVDGGSPEGGIEGGIEGESMAGYPLAVVGEILQRMIGVEEAPVRAIGEIRQPRLIRRVEPVYPEIARQARVAGVVILEATTDATGRVQAVRILRSVPLLNEAAIDAVRRWVYEPMIVNGRPRGVTFSVTVRFELS